MKRVILTLCVVFSTLLSSSQVVFKSPTFENGVRQHLKIDSTVVLKQQMLDTITNINLSNLSLKYIDDINFLTKLRSVNFSNNEIKDITPLISLPYVKSIDLSNNGISDLSILAFSDNRYYSIDISDNLINDFSMFEKSSFSNIILIGSDKQLRNESTTFELNNLYTQTRDNGQSIICYDIWDSQNLCNNFSYDFGENQSLDLECDSYVHKINYDYYSSGFKNISIKRNGKVLKSHFIAPYTINYNSIISNTIEIDLPEEVKLFDVINTNTNNSVYLNDNIINYNFVDTDSDTLRVSYNYENSLRKEEFYIFLEESRTLPINLFEFKGKVSSNDAFLNWSTSSEINSKEFIVEKSFDGFDFVEVEVVKAKGYSLDKTFYEMIDYDSVHGNVFYKLKLVDLDGNFEYSNIILLSDSINSFSLAPIPTKDYIYISTKESIKAIEVFNVNGKNLITLRDHEINKVDLSDYIPGIYILKFQFENGYITSRKIMKK